MQKIVKQNPAYKAFGIFPVLVALVFMFFVYSNFSDDFFAGIRPLFYLIGSMMILMGVGMLFSTTELIYNEETIEKRTRIFGLSWSHKVDRSLVRDIGPEAAGLIARRPYRYSSPHEFPHHHSHDHAHIHHDHHHRPD